MSRRLVVDADSDLKIDPKTTPTRYSRSEPTIFNYQPVIVTCVSQISGTETPLTNSN